jgi:hypothetical protein
MTPVAPQRLIDAAGSLEPADRALLDLLVKRGFDNDSLARLSRVNAAAIVARRERIVNRLSDELGLPTDQVRGTLDELGVTPLGPGAARPAPANGNGAHTVRDPPDPPGTAPPLVATPVATPAVVEALGTAGRVGVADLPHSAEPRSPRRRLVSATVAVLGVAAVVVVLALGSPKPLRHAAVTRLTAGAANPSTATAAASSAPGPAAPVAPPAPITTPARPRPLHPRSAAGAYPQRLAILPGGTSQASGSIALAGSAAHPRLRLRITGLIAARAGYYEAWLYNSILDSAPLIQLRSGRTSFSARLPHNYRRYQRIDISFQPPGMANDSGESVMRARVPGPDPGHRP